MPCEKYQDALTDLAAKGAEPAGDVRAHLDSCVACSSYMEQEVSLITAINSGVQAAANASVPASLLQRFEARIAQEAEAKAHYPCKLELCARCRRGFDRFGAADLAISKREGSHRFAGISARISECKAVGARRNGQASRT